MKLIYVLPILLMPFLTSAQPVGGGLSGGFNPFTIGQMQGGGEYGGGYPPGVVICEPEFDNSCNEQVLFEESNVILNEFPNCTF